MDNVGPSARFPCVGIVVIREHAHELQTILVERKKGHYSFPKGKMEKKKDKTYLEGAFREMNEETGLYKEDVELLKQNGEYLFIEELSSKEKPSVLYFIGKYVKENKHKFTYDQEELQGANWYSYKEALKKCELNLLRASRKDVLNKAVEMYNNYA